MLEEDAMAKRESYRAYKENYDPDQDYEAALNISHDPERAGRHRDYD
jgi:hypothetical protein